MTIDKLVINGDEWKVEFRQNIKTRDSFWGANTQLKTIYIFNVDDDGGDFARYLIYKYKEAARLQYTKN